MDFRPDLGQIGVWILVNFQIRILDDEDVSEIQTEACPVFGQFRFLDNSSFWTLIVFEAYKKGFTWRRGNKTWSCYRFF